MFIIFCIHKNIQDPGLASEADSKALPSATTSDTPPLADVSLDDDVHHPPTTTTVIPPATDSTIAPPDDNVIEPATQQVVDDTEPDVVTVDPGDATVAPVLPSEDDTLKSEIEVCVC